MTTGRNKRDDGKQSAGESKRLTNEVLSLGFSVLICVGLGVFLDSIFKTAPLFILLGVFLALASMAYILWQIVKAS